MINKMLGFTSLDRQMQEGNNMETTIDGRIKLFLELILTRSHKVGWLVISLNVFGA